MRKLNANFIFKSVGFYEQKQEQTDLISRSPSPRSPTPVCLTYPASDYVPERPPTPQYTSQQFNLQTTTTTSSSTINQYNNQFDYQSNLPQSDKHIYSRSNVKQVKSFKKKDDFSAIDEWQRKMTDDFNQLYSTLEKSFELKRLRETGMNNSLNYI